MNPYGYVNGNPETRSDPTGQLFIGDSGGTPPSQSPPHDDYWNDPAPLNDAGSHVPSGIVTAKPRPPARPTWNDPFTGLTSCGIAGSQAICAYLHALYALYLSTGDVLGIPGVFCFDCGPFGGGTGDDEYGHESDLAFSNQELGGSPQNAEAILGDPYAFQDEELVFEHPNAQAAFESTLRHLEQLGGPLGDDLVTTQVRVSPDHPEVLGLDNGFQTSDGNRGWRLDYDDNPKKGLHFNWYDWTNGKRRSGLGRYGAETFPGTYEDFIEMLLRLNTGGVEYMLGN